MQVIFVEFPEEFKNVSFHEKDNIIFMNLLYSEPSCELQYTLPTPK